MQRIPFAPRRMRMSYYLGLALILVGVSLIGAVAGYLIADRLPRTVAASLIFLTPIYFLLGLLGNARRRADYAPILLGLCAAPVFMQIAPSFDLIAAGLFGGTVSFLFVRRRGPKLRSPARMFAMPDSAWSLWLVLLAAGVANEVWRLAGVWLSRAVDPEAPLVLWVKDVSTALVAALIVRLLLAPTGALKDIGGLVSGVAFGVGVAAYFVSRRSLLIGLASAEAAFFLFQWALA